MLGLIAVVFREEASLIGIKLEQLDDDAEALESLSDRYRPPVLRFIRGRGFSEWDAEDLCQEVFARLFAKNVFALADSARGFAQQSSKRQHLYILNNAMQVAQSESKKIIEVYKAQYDQEHEQEVKSLKAELQKSQQELIKNQAMLATLEEDHKNAEVEKSKLLAEIHKLNVQQSSTTEEVDIETKLESTQDGLLRVNTSIKNVKQSIDNAKAAMEKTKWKQDKEAAEQHEMDNDLTIALQNEKQSSAARDEMRQRLEMFISNDTKEIDSE